MEQQHDRKKDGSRKNALLKAKCSVCGNLMDFTTGITPNAETYSDRNITGADKVDVFLTIHPCNTCYSKATEPLEALKKIFKDFS